MSQGKYIPVQSRIQSKSIPGNSTSLILILVTSSTGIQFSYFYSNFWICSILDYIVIQLLLFYVIASYVNIDHFVVIFLECMDIKLNLSYYASIMLDTFKDLLCSKLCWHNRPGPNPKHLVRVSELKLTHYQKGPHISYALLECFACIFINCKL